MTLQNEIRFGDINSNRKTFPNFMTSELTVFQWKQNIFFLFCSTHRIYTIKNKQHGKDKYYLHTGGPDICLKPSAYTQNLCWKRINKIKIKLRNYSLLVTFNWPYNHLTSFRTIRIPHRKIDRKLEWWTAFPAFWRRRGKTRRAVEKLRRLDLWLIIGQITITVLDLFS